MAARKVARSRDGQAKRSVTVGIRVKSALYVWLLREQADLYRERGAELSMGETIRALLEKARMEKGA